MSRRPSTQFGEPLSDESAKLVREVRRLTTIPCHPKFDTDFNIYRFVACAERVHRSRREVVQHAAKALDQHLRVRNCLKLDTLPERMPDPRDIPLFRDKRLMPWCDVLAAEEEEEGECTDSRNRLLWFIEYATMSVEKIAHGVRSSESIICQFWLFENMLRLVNKQERKSGRLSSVRHVIDMTGHEINPFTAVFVSSGTLSYYSQLFHYDNYPELVYPIEMVNITAWIHLPYRMIKTMMPAGFTDRFRLHDSNFLDTLAAEMPIEHIPQSLGGRNQSVHCVPALPHVRPWQPEHPRLLDALQCLHIGPRKFKCFRVHIDDGEAARRRSCTLSWYFRTEGDIFFGVFFAPADTNSDGGGGGEKNGGIEANGHHHHNGKNGGGEHHHKRKLPVDASNAADHHHLQQETVLSQMEWVYPWLKLSAKFHHEWDCVDCTRPGTYLVLFSNKHSWLHRRTVEALVQLEEVSEADDGRRKKTTLRRVLPEGTQTEEQQYDDEREEEEDEGEECLRECLGMDPAQLYGGGPRKTIASSGNGEVPSAAVTTEEPAPAAL